MRDVEGKSRKEIAEYFQVTPQAVSAALGRTKGSEASLQPWPWKLKAHHVEGSNALYRLMLAYRKHAAGKEVSEAELRDANALRRAASKWGMVISYRPDIGFFWTKPRNAAEKEQMFVKR